ncbi:hypothetical protein LXL04_031698 [Taraxacum kok-saghyz]
MQGQRGAIGSFPATLAFEHGSSSNDANVIDQQICFETSMQNSPSNDLFLNATANQEGQNLSMWNAGEPSSSSSPNPGHIEPRPDRGWSSLMKSCPELPSSSSMLSLGDHHNASMNLSMASSSSFSDPFGSSSDPINLDDRRLSRKRKAVELGVGQSSSSSGIRIGSSDMFQRSESGHGNRESPPTSESIIPRLGLSVGGGNETSHNRRNVLRINSSRQQDLLPGSSNNREPDISGLYPSLRLNPVDFITPPVAATPDNLPNQNGQQPVLRIPALRRNIQSTSRWSRNPSSRANRSSNLVIPGDRNELDSISDHPLFAQPSYTRTAVQPELNWSSNVVGGGGGGVGGAASNAGIGASGSSSGQIPTSAPPNSVPPRVSPHYNPRRLSAFLRRSLLSAADSDIGGPNNNPFPRMPPGVSTSELGIPIPPVVSNNHQHHSRSSVLVGRQIDGAFGFPYLSRTMTGGSEGRGRLVSEIRNVLDLMRRGEPLRFEDLMILDQSVFYGIADMHDRHRDMRLDIDNMSYEELLALEERIGNVNTGLTEETILKHLKPKLYVAENSHPDIEPCCICQEEYNDGDDLGTLDCGHDFHQGCIKKWLQHKNSCPICKSTGFAKP